VPGAADGQMGQAPAAPRMCRTQEIMYEPTNEEWQTVDEWSEAPIADSGYEGLPYVGCRALCCRPQESDVHVDEVLVVHHDVLQKVQFLLRHDELQSCESPAVPECVMAMRRARIQKRLMQQGMRPGAGAGAVHLAAAPEQTTLSVDVDGDPSDEDIPSITALDECSIPSPVLPNLKGTEDSASSPMTPLLPRLEDLSLISLSPEPTRLEDSDFAAAMPIKPGEKSEGRIP